MTKRGGFSWPRPFKRARAVDPDWPKNWLHARKNQQLALEALTRGVCLSLRYHDCGKVVEVHTIGTNSKDRPAMSVYQVDGQCNDSAILGWAFFCFDECFNVALADRPSGAPRPGYRKGAKQFRRIDAEV